MIYKPVNSHFYFLEGTYFESSASLSYFKTFCPCYISSDMVQELHYITRSKKGKGIQLLFCAIIITIPVLF